MHIPTPTLRRCAGRIKWRVDINNPLRGAEQPPRGWQSVFPRDRSCRNGLATPTISFCQSRS